MTLDNIVSRVLTQFVLQRMSKENYRYFTMYLLFVLKEKY